jgi:hypothetical protein
LQLAQTEGFRALTRTSMWFHCICIRVPPVQVHRQCIKDGQYRFGLPGSKSIPPKSKHAHSFSSRGRESRGDSGADATR